MSVCGVILSGGKSSRMGTNKSLLQINGKTVIEHISNEMQKCCDQLVVVANDINEYSFLKLPIISDRYIDKGPLAGIETALYHVDAETFVFAACDMPFIQANIFQFLLNKLEDYDAVVPVYGGQVHPLASIYRKSILLAVQEQLENNELRVKSFFNQMNVRYMNNFESIEDKDLKRHFFNMNYPDQYIQAIKTF